MKKIKTWFNLIKKQDAFTIAFFAMLIAFICFVIAIAGNFEILADVSLIVLLAAISIGVSIRVFKPIKIKS